MQKKSFSLLVSSDEENGALNVTNNGSKFDVQYSSAINIPRDAIDCTLEVDEATIWWTVPNISAGLGNNKFHYTYNAVTKIITVQDGLYDLNGYASAINNAVINNGHPSGLFTFTEDTAAGKVVITITTVIPITGEIDFTQSDTARDILGFNSGTVGPNTIDVEVFTADNVAAFNIVNYFLLHSDMVDNGLPTNNRFDNTIAQVLIDVTPGSQILYKPFRPPKISADRLIGAIINKFGFWLTDDKGDFVNTNNEVWSVRTTISYFMKLEK